MTFDPDGPALSDAGPYGLPHTLDEATTILVPVPFEATVSFGTGTMHGPAAIALASHQVDLLDADMGHVYRCGIAMEEAPAWIAELNDRARVAATRVIEAHTGGAVPDTSDIADVDAAGDRVNAHVFERVAAVLGQGKLPVVIGGDHSVPLGAIKACAAHLGDKPLGILHLDAHLDLRDAYEGFRWSHASIMKNVLDAVPTARLVQFGIRDFSLGELGLVREQPARITTYFDSQLREARLRGRFLDVAKAIVAALPDDVYLSFDIDGLDPVLCPSTGTPVPGGLSFDELVAVLVLLSQSGKRIVGLDLVEVAPPADADDDDARADCWDANVAARLLYKMIGCAWRTRGVVYDEPLPRPPGL